MATQHKSNTVVIVNINDDKQFIPWADAMLRRTTMVVKTPKPRKKFKVPSGTRK